MLNIPAEFGKQTLTFVAFTAGTRGSLGTYVPGEVPTVVPGCRHRPLSAKETAEYDLNVSTMVFKTTAPPVAGVLNAQPDGEIREGSEVYKIIGGPQHHRDMAGNPFKVTILSQKQTS
jgi:hypothetical protein